MQLQSSSDLTDRVRQAVVLQQVIGRYVRLKPAGAGRLAGLCPFHREKSPSFTVSTNKNLWLCFGCHAGGDVFSFVQRIEGLSFPEARKMLADEHGVRVDQRVLSPQEAAAQRRQMILAKQLAEEASAWWAYVRERYQSRFDVLMQIAVGASDQGWEDSYQRYARRAWRWGKILRRLDGMAAPAALQAYRRIAGRRAVATAVACRLALGRDAGATWGRIIAASDHITPEKLERIVERMAAAVPVA